MKPFIAPLLIGALGAGLLLWLGAWQLDRLAWKRAILSEIDATIAGPPGSLPRMIEPANQRYRPVALDGRIGGAAIFVLVSARQVGAGWRVVSPFETNDGRRVLVDRGFAPVDAKDAPLFAGTARVEGHLHWPDDRTGSTPANDPDTNTWFARDIAPMAEMLETEPLLVIAARLSPPDRQVTPLPVNSSGIPNNHLNYAITWFSLAAVWLAMSGFWIWRRRQGKES